MQYQQPLPPYEYHQDGQIPLQYPNGYSLMDNYNLGDPAWHPDLQHFDGFAPYHGAPAMHDIAYTGHGSGTNSYAYHAYHPASDSIPFPPHLPPHLHSTDRQRRSLAELNRHLVHPLEQELDPQFAHFPIARSAPLAHSLILPSSHVMPGDGFASYPIANEHHHHDLSFNPVLLPSNHEIGSDTHSQGRPQRLSDDQRETVMDPFVPYDPSAHNKSGPYKSSGNDATAGARGPRRQRRTIKNPPATKLRRGVPTQVGAENNETSRKHAARALKRDRAREREWKARKNQDPNSGWVAEDLNSIFHVRK